MSAWTKPVVAGNWKMHKAPQAAQSFLRDFMDRHAPGGAPVAFFVPAVSLQAAADMAHERRDVWIGAQNIHWEESGAFTGETSAAMAREAGATLTLIGHSERRHLFGETDDDVARKLRAALAAGLLPMVCVGETLEERRAGRVEEVILRQLDAALGALDADTIGRVAFAYEPVWAIGTGETATPADAAAAHATLRDRLRERFGDGAADAAALLYGGSVKPGNAAELMAAAGVDGVLVGGASLDPADFAVIAAAAPAVSTPPAG